MNTLFIKLIFLLITLYIFFYCSSYAGFEIKSKNNIIAGVVIFLFTVASVIFSNIIFWIN